MRRVWLLLALAFVLEVHAYGLVDEPYMGDSIQYLDGTPWTALSSLGLQINASVPGDLITDLEYAGVIDDPLYELVWIQNSSLWDSADWTYTCIFSLQNSSWLSTTEVYLVFDGIKMSADIALNGQLLGSAFNQFQRYVFPVKSLLQAAKNTLRVTFRANDPRMDPEDRFMACSGGWDWAPYSSLATGQTPLGIRSLAKGIWKSVYIVPVSTVAITDISPLVFYTGPYPITPLTDNTKAAFNVSVRVFLTSPGNTPVSGTLRLAAVWTGTVITMPVTVQGDTAVTMPTLVAQPDEVGLWWPNGLGFQPLYNITVMWQPSSASGEPIAVMRNIGFRTFALVTDDDTNPGQLSGVSGSGNLTMRFRVNGANIWARGANWIPMEDYDGRSDPEAIDAALTAAAEANMNILRVWGGGIWEYDEFYDAADNLGIMIYHDAMYSNQDDSYHMPAPSNSQQLELTHQIRRLSAHPSIVIWDGCNECGGSGVVQGFVTPIIALEDPSRSIWPSSPSSGWLTGVDRLTSRANNQSMSVIPASAPVTNVTGGVLQANANYAGFPVYGIVNISTAEGCVAECGKTSGCAVALYAGVVCVLQGFIYQPVTEAQGLTACIPYPNNAPPSPFVPTTVPAGAVNEHHGPYQHGSGFPAVNGMGMDLPIDTMLPPSLKPVATYGPSAPGIFVSEFGASSMSSFESMSATLAPQHWSLHGGSTPDTCGNGFYSHCNGSNVMSQRNYPCDNYYSSYYGTRPVYPISAVGESALKAQLYLCQLASALNLKSVIEWQRSQNLWGLMEWQLNEIWPTGGWGSIEYGTVGFTNGQVLGGRWKPLHYFLASTLYQDVFAACGSDGRCYVKNDNPLNGFSGTLYISLERFEDGKHIPVATVPVSLPAGANAMQWLCAGSSSVPPTTCPAWSAVLPKLGCWGNGSDCLLNLTVVAGSLSVSNQQLLASPASLLSGLSKAPATVQFGKLNENGYEIELTVTVPSPSLYVHLTTLASGRFSENSFSLVSTLSKNVTFYAVGTTIDVDLLESSLRMEHLGQYIK